MSKETELRTDVEYSAEIIVLAKYNDEFNYYISDKGFWMFTEEFRAGSEEDIDSEKKRFLENMEAFKVDRKR